MFSIHESVVASLADILKRVIRVFGAPPLSEQQFAFLYIPVRDQSENEGDFVKRHWKIQEDDALNYGFGVFYDSQNGSMVEFSRVS
jgi:hypothetical protein